MDKQDSRIRTLLIGLGKIGANLSTQELENTFQGTENISHAKTLSARKEFDITAGIDSDQDIRSMFASEYSKSVFGSLHDYSYERGSKVDLVVIATNTNSHLKVLQEVIENTSPRLLICEKPMGQSELETQSIIDLCQANEVLCIPGYFRKFNKRLISLRQRISTKEFGAFEDGIVCYGQDLMVNGCHFLNLALYLLGDLLKKVEIVEISAGKTRNPTFEVLINSGSSIRFVGVNSYFRRTGEVRLNFDSGSVSYQNGGSRLEVARNSRKGNFFGPEDERYEINALENIENFYDEIVSCFMGLKMHESLKAGSLEIYTQRIINKVIIENEAGFNERKQGGR